MVFCPNCGAEVQGKFCAKCGTQVTSAAGGASAPPPPRNPSGSAYAPPPPPGAQPHSGYAPPPGAQPYAAPAQTGGLTENVAGTLAYILGLITGIVFLVLEPYNRSKFVRFHAFQAIFLHVAFIVFWIALSIVTAVLPFSLWVLTSILSMVVSLGGLALWIICMVKAYNHDKLRVPVISDIAEKQA